MMQFDTKFFLIFGATMLVVLFIGAGNLSFKEARSKADADESSLKPDQLRKLKESQDKFAEMAFPPCIKTTDSVPGEFTIVVEIGSDGHVTRSWRQGDSSFVICFQRIMIDNFIFRSPGQTFFSSYEYSRAS